MTLADRLWRAVLAWVPGTPPNIAARKRRLVRELQARGYSRSGAKAIAGKRFGT